ncbi:MAG: hypothetical protein KJ970_10795 [Candidatus Eisenbacteria bacterium]|uniref:FlgD/Vpr Ig-like domain-containing protein n=1 Tax=Eiseniibacteriota bacterium TaxID=2212470 RepID=A0A948W3S0_UNCEI|nr:hypothetical protein [Candidatus Eisenbacteria bacterium]MBU1950201.1 hypothetical protein [Candidatus Eisenbacteria bacterium]MBU2691402.1 hypothetical protein [Candidatus Eisenbacteria bacterium]
MRFPRLCILCSFLILLVWSVGYALPETDEYQLNDEVFGTGEARSPVIAGLPDSSYLYVWIDSRRGQRDIFAVQMTEEGEPISELKLLNDDDRLANQFNPVMAFSPDYSSGWVAWIDVRQYTNVYTQRILKDASLVGENIPILTNERGGSPTDLDIAVQEDGTALLVYRDFRYQAHSLFGRRVSPDGVPLGDNDVILVDEESARNPSIAACPGGGWILTWEERSNGADDEIWFRRFTDQLEAIGFSVRLAADTGEQSEPTVEVMPDSSLLILWKDTTGGASELYFNYYSIVGAPLGGKTAVQEIPAGAEELYNNLSIQPDGSFMVNWLGFQESDWLPMVRIFEAGGAPASDIITVDNPGNVVGLSVASTAAADGRYASVWVDERSGAGLAYMKMVDSSGDLAEYPTRLMHVEPGATQLFPDVALRDDGSGMAVWVDQQTGNPNLFGRFLHPNGSPSGPSFLISAEPLGRFGDPLDITSVIVATPRVAATPTKNYLATWLINTETGRGRVMAQVFDPAGEVVGNNFAVPLISSSPQSTPTALVDESSGLMAVVWEDNSTSSGGDIFMQRYSPEGLETYGGIINLVDLNARTASQYYSAADISDYGQIVVAWTDGRNGGLDIYAQEYFMTADNLPLANKLVGGEDEGENFVQAHPDVAVGPGSYVIVWDDNSYGTIGVHARLYTPPSFMKESWKPGQSLPRPPEDTLLIVSENPQADISHWPRVSMNEDGRFIVTWWDNYEGQAKIMGRTYEADGRPLSEPFLVTPLREGAFRYSPAVDAHADSIRFVFADTRRDLGWDVYVRRADWTFQGDSIPDTTGTTPVLIASAGIEAHPGGLRLQWEAPADLSPSSFLIARRGPLVNPDDPRSGAYTLYGDVSWLDPDARIMGWMDTDLLPGETYAYWILMDTPQGVDPQAGPFIASYQVRLSFQATPSPFTKSVSMTLPPASSRRTVEIYDVQGRRVWRKAWSAGPTPLNVMWDGRDQSGRKVAQGVYWARVRGCGDQPAVRLLKLGR